MTFEWKLIEQDCTGCGTCADICPTIAILMLRMMAYPEPVAGGCTGCLDCTRECPFDAIRVRDLRAEAAPGQPQ